MYNFCVRVCLSVCVCHHTFIMLSISIHERATASTPSSAQWKGKGLNEKGYDTRTKKNIIFIDKNYIRPLDVNTLLGNASKARKQLSWTPKTNINQLIEEMISEELNILNVE